MPKVNKDNQLFEKVGAFVAGERSFEAAAARLEVKTTTLWRFAKNGTAIARTRKALERGLAKVERESEMARPGSSAPVQGMGLKALAGDDLREMRALCSRMVAWIDMAESALASSRATGGPGRSGGPIEQHGGQHGR